MVKKSNKNPARKPARKPATKKLPKLKFPDLVRQSVTFVLNDQDEPLFADLSDKEKNLVVQEVLTYQQVTIEEIVRAFTMKAYVDLFVDEDDELDDEEDDELDDEEDDEDEDEDEDDEDEDEDEE